MALTQALFRVETANDGDEIKRLMGLGFAPSHAQRNIWTLRDGGHIAALSLVAEDSSRSGYLLGSIRFWPITIAGKSSVLLGPLAVDPELRGQGIGMELVKQGLTAAKAHGFHYCFVSGEPEYYPKLGFSKLKSADLTLPAEIEEPRLHMIPISADGFDDLGAKPWIVLPSKI